MINVQKPNREKSVNISASTPGIKGIRIEGRHSGSGSDSGSSRSSSRSKTFTTKELPEAPAFYRTESNAEIAKAPSAFEMLANPEKLLPAKEDYSEEDQQPEAGSGGGIFSNWFGSSSKKPEKGEESDISERESSNSSVSDYNRDKKTTANNTYSGDYKASTTSGYGSEASDTEYLTDKQKQKRKMEYLSQLSRLKKKGVYVSPSINTNSGYTDVKNEYMRIRADLDIENGVQFSRKMLVLCISGLEFLNNRYDPFKLKLNGWSETVMEDIDSYDDVFEELYKKYSDVGDMAPELKLMLMIGGSGFMYNMMQNASSFGATASGGRAFENNPEVMQNLINIAKKYPQSESVNTGAEAPNSSYTQPATQLPIPAPFPVHSLPVDGYGREFMPNRPMPNANESHFSGEGVAPSHSNPGVRGPSESISDIVKKMQNSGNSSSSGSSGSDSNSSDSDHIQYITVDTKKGRGSKTIRGRGRGRGRGGVTTVNIPR